MTTKPVCRVGDEVIGTCNGSGHPAGRPFIGCWSTGSDVLTADGLGVVLLGDSGVTDCGHIFTASSASSIASVSGVGVHRVGDQVLTEGGGVGHSVSGSASTTSM